MSEAREEQLKERKRSFLFKMWLVAQLSFDGDVTRRVHRLLLGHCWIHCQRERFPLYTTPMRKLVAYLRRDMTIIALSKLVTLRVGSQLFGLHYHQRVGQAWLAPLTCNGCAWIPIRAICHWTLHDLMLYLQKRR